MCWESDSMRWPSARSTERGLMSVLRRLRGNSCGAAGWGLFCLLLFLSAARAAPESCSNTAETFAEVVDRRFSAKEFEPLTPIPEEAIEQMLALARRSPSSFNTQYASIDTSHATTPNLPPHPLHTDTDGIAGF